MGIDPSRFDELKAKAKPRPYSATAIAAKHRLLLRCAAAAAAVASNFLREKNEPSLAEAVTSSN